jgi:hypothetical protein
VKTSLKIEDKAFSNLLRAQFGQQGGSLSACSEFDPDLANAYVEHSLTPVMQTRYERHLSECSGCRTSVVALARMAQTDSVPLQAAGRAVLGSSEPSWLTSIKEGLFALASPRWAAAAALIILAVGIPALMWQSGRFGGSDAVPAENLAAQRAPAPAVATESQVDMSSSNPADTVKKGKDPARAASTAKAPAAGETVGAFHDGLSSASVAKRESNEQSSQQVGQAAGETSEKKTDVGTVADGTDEFRAKARTEKLAGGAAASAPAARDGARDGAREGARESTVLSKISKDEALRVPAEDRDSVSVKLRPGSVDSGPTAERERAAATITPRDAEAPKTKEAGNDVARGTLTRRGGTSALLESDSARAIRARSPQKKVGKKTFWLSKGIWTDQDYEPTKDMPIVTVVRASDVYREMLEKKNKLSSFLTGFAEGDRAIIVYKSIVYKLIPHPDNK